MVRNAIFREIGIGIIPNDKEAAYFFSLLVHSNAFLVHVKHVQKVLTKGLHKTLLLTA